MICRTSFNPALYFIADPSLCAGREVSEIVVAAIKGGAAMVQYRNKNKNMPEILAEAGMLAEIIKPYSIPFLVNDHIEVAFAVSADGVHLGQGDSSPQEARARLGAQAIIGQTAFTPEHMRAIDPAIVDYVGTGPFYPTQTDKGKPVLGAERFTILCKESPVPVIGIGGITPKNAKAVMSAGAQGIAVMRAISQADNPEDVARKLYEAVS